MKAEISDRITIPSWQELQAGLSENQETIKNPYIDIAGIEIISLGGLIASGGGFAFSETVAVILAGTATTGSIIAGTIATGGCLILGGAIILIGVDLLTGDGLDKTKEVINTIF